MSDDKQMTTLKSSLELINQVQSSDKKVDLRALKGKQIGLSFLKLGIAEIEARRIGRLMPIIDQLEQDIFNPDKLKRLSDSEKIERYQLAMGSLATASGYVQNAIGSIDWATIQTELIELEAQTESGESLESQSARSDMNAKAKKLLNQLGK